MPTLNGSALMATALVVVIALNHIVLGGSTALDGAAILAAMVYFAFNRPRSRRH